jgi:MoaA/NifB/PqqE/SkfB family radical SAM enzyme
VLVAPQVVWHPFMFFVCLSEEFMNISKAMMLKMLARGSWNWWRKYPLSVSFEITHACTANCWHCNLGGPIKETRLGPEEYAAICRELNPVVSHLSGGEPLVRSDVYEILSAMSNPGKLPLMVVVSNASQLTPERFLKLKRAGMHQLSLSIDFPDDRHSDFRRIPGLFDRMNEVVPECTRIGDPEDVSLNCCITAWNYKELPEIVKLGERWGVPVNFSAYSAMRTDEAEGLVGNNGSNAELKRAIETVIDLKHAGKPVFTAERALWKYYDFLTTGYTSGCQAGNRFVVINPDGRLTPCAAVMAYYDDHRTMQREFSEKNTCGACYISTRASTEKTKSEMLGDNVDHLKRLLPWN